MSVAATASPATPSTRGISDTDAIPGPIPGGKVAAMSAPVGARTTKDVPGNAPCGAVNVKSSKARRTAAPEGFWVVALTCKSNSESGLAPPRDRAGVASMA